MTADAEAPDACTPVVRRVTGPGAPPWDWWCDKHQAGGVHSSEARARLSAAKHQAEFIGF